MMEFALIALVNLIWLPTLWFGLVTDDAVGMFMHPFPIKRTKAFNVIMHVVIAEYIYIAFGQTPSALMAAVLFSVHPICVQIPAWISGRQYGINALCMLFTLTFLPLGALAYFISTGGVATLMFTPLIFLTTKYWWLVFILPFYFWRSYKSFKAGIEGKVKGGDAIAALPTDIGLLEKHPRKLILVVKTFGFYALSCLLPIKNGFYNSFLQTFGSSEKHTRYWYSLNRHFWGGLLTMGLMFVLWLKHMHDPIGIGIMIFVTSIIPFLNFITVQQFTAPRYAYLPLIGFQVAFCGVLTNYIGVNMGLLIMAGLFAFYLDRLKRVMRHYKTNNVDMMELEAEVFPDNPRLWYFFCEHMANKHNPIMAFAEATWGTKYHPEDGQLFFGLACAAFELGFIGDASRFLDMADKYMLTAGMDVAQKAHADLREQVRSKMGLLNRKMPQKQAPFYRGVA